MIDNEPWFIAKDICNVLGHTNSRVAIQMLDDDERGKESLPRQGQTWIVNESGLYNLIFRSNKPEAKAFRKWVTGEVLPQIRRNGSYTPKQVAKEVIDARCQAYETTEINGREVRVIDIDGTDYYHLKDVINVVGSATETQQTAKKLNAVKPLARKIWIYGVNYPSWFTNRLGVDLVLSASRKLRSERQVLLLEGGSYE